MSEPEFPPVSAGSFSASIMKVYEWMVQHKLVNLHYIASQFCPIQTERSHLWESLSKSLGHFVRHLLHPWDILVTIFCTLFNLDLVTTSLQAIVLSQYNFW